MKQKTMDLLIEFETRRIQRERDNLESEVIENTKELLNILENWLFISE